MNPREPGRRGHSIYLAVAIVASAILAFVLFNLPWPRDREVWMGSKGLGLIEAFSLIATPVGIAVALIGLVVNGRTAAATHKLAQEEELARRFETAARLMNDERDFVQTSGAALLTSVARAAPGEYLSPSIEVLTNYIDDRCSDIVSAYYKKSLKSFDELPESHSGVLGALRKLSSLRPDTGWPSDLVRVGQHLPVGALYLSGSTVENLVLPSISASRWIISNAKIGYCNFRFSELTFIIGPDVEFQGCVFDYSRLTILDLDLKQVPSRSKALRMQFFTGTTRNATVNERPMSEWLGA